MGFLDALASFFHKSRTRDDAQEEKLRQAFRDRCRHFKALLSANKRALTEMAVLEESLRGERLFGMSFVRAQCTTILANVFNIVRHLNALSGNRYAALHDRLKVIQQEIADSISTNQTGGNGPLVLSLDAVDFSMAHEVGAKMASLGEAGRALSRHIPKGFVVTASGYRRFIAANSLQEEINRRMQMTDLSRLDAVFALSSSLQQLVISATVPDDLAALMYAGFAALEKEHPGATLAVRSSAIGEDAHGASYAGQYLSELNVSKDYLLQAYKEVVASKYGVTAMSYRINRGIPDDEVPMCVGCMHMLDAVSGGVAYSRDPLGRGNEVVINAVMGLPRSVVDGSAPVDTFRVGRTEPLEILSRQVVQKPFMLQNEPEGGIVKKALCAEEGARASLSDGQIHDVASAALAFESFYGQAQDVEWAYVEDGTLVILQSRALSDVAEEPEPAPAPESALTLCSGGVCASPGVGCGEVFFVRRDADMLRFPRGAVLLVEQAHARWAPILSRASAVVSDFGGTAGHLASVAREYGLPALFGLSGACTTLESGKVVTVDADALRVYDGKVEEALGRKREPRQLFAGSPVFTLLEKAASYIVPLNLLDPDSPEFSPKHCMTLHDITRFCHEKAVEEMFHPDGMGADLFASRYGKQLRYKGSKLQYFVVNIENGFCKPEEGRFIEMEDICCKPMQALWQGMIAIPWAGPVATTGRGFLSLVAESAGNPELEITSASPRLLRNYFLVDRDYCNLQASFGYHFCTVEAQAGESEQENYVNFHFKGGAAHISRRMVRVHALSDVLVENGFLVDVKEDALSARAEELPAEDVYALLGIIGYLLVHSRQMDVALSGQDSRVAFADMLRSGIAKVVKEGISFGDAAS